MISSIILWKQATPLVIPDDDILFTWYNFLQSLKNIVPIAPLEMRTRVYELAAQGLLLILN